MGGYEIHCQEIVNWFKAQGHTCFVLTSNYQLETSPQAAEEGIYRLLPFRADRDKHMPLRTLYHLEKQSQQIVKQVLNTLKPDVIYVWNLWSMPPSIAYALEQSGIPLVYQIDHSWLVEFIPHDPWLVRIRNKRNPFKRLIQQSLKALSQYQGLITQASQLKTQRIIFVSRYRLDEHRQASQKVEQAAVVPLAMLPSAYQAPNRQHADLRLLFVSRFLTPAKGTLMAIQALHQLHEKGVTGITLDLYGEWHPDHAEYNQQARALIEKSGGLIRLQGSLSHAELIPLYAQYDALLFCSNYPEGMPLVIGEAYTSRLPVIGTPSGGAAEMLDPLASITVPIEDVDAMVAAILKLHQDPAFHRRLQQGCLEVIEQHFLEANVMAEVERILTEAAHSKP